MVIIFELIDKEKKKEGKIQSLSHRSIFKRLCRRVLDHERYLVKSNHLIRGSSKSPLGGFKNF